MRLLPALLSPIIACQLAANCCLAQSHPPGAPGGYQRITGQSNPALRYFAGTPATSAPSAARPTPRAAANDPSPPPTRVSKPFENTPRGPIVSPYLALDVNEGLTGMPAYYALVRPRLDQMRQNQTQQA
ncbi:MAG: hypothetical protein AAF961_16705, partial [Planctomycetota bacterium]